MIDLDALILEAREKQQAAEQALQQERQDAEALLRQDGIAKFIELVRGEIGEELLDALHPVYEARLHQKTCSVSALWHDEESDTDWELSAHADASFTLKAVNKRHESMLNWGAVRKGDLREQLLVGIGFVRDNVLMNRVKAEAARIEREEQRIQDERDRQLREQEEADLLTAADEINAEIEALIARRIEEETAKLWQWKPGATITLYMVKYCTGTRYVEEEGSEFDYATGWTLNDAFNEDGYVTLMNGKPRHLLLDPYTHMPIWERHSFASIDDLPAALRERSGFVVKDITKRNFSDGHWRWGYEYSEAWGCTAAPEGLPAQWVRELVDQA